jgi:hypothetical protein
MLFDSNVQIKYSGRFPKLSKWCDPFLVLSQEDTAYLVQDLSRWKTSLLMFLSQALRSFYSFQMKLQWIVYIDTSEEAFDYIVSYTGEPRKKNSNGFRVHRKDSESDENTYHRHHQISKSAALDSFIQRRPELSELNKQ